ILGGALSLTALAIRPRPKKPVMRITQPNRGLSIEPHAEVQLSAQTAAVLQTLFAEYGRLVVAQEFPMGYSGAQTYLVQPIDPEGRADAYTVVKIGPRGIISREFDNYESFVKKRLPPVTGRIQHPPVTLRGSSLAGVQYTFIGEPGQPPTSLRQALLEQPTPEHLYRLFDTFGPSWWMQRRPFNFRLAQEYDRFLPPHYVVEPASGRGPALDGRQPPGQVSFEAGRTVVLRGFSSRSRADGSSLTLSGAGHPGQPGLRVHWMGRAAPNGAAGKITATRSSTLQSLVAGFDRFGLPDPLERLASIEQEMVQGTQSIVHGDLNLENILVGPGGIVWLIDFAETREGHTLLDFAHLHAEIIAHVIAPRIGRPEAYLEELGIGKDPLLGAVREIAGGCLFDSKDMREYDLALYMFSLGSLKFANLTEHARHLLYLTASHLSASL
ncbi:MAG: phosphotransferase, partial [Anaerolineales bacterium]|nr:phosphotransferase [Anaerolineales bacterium]